MFSVVKVKEYINFSTILQNISKRWPMVRKNDNQKQPTGDVTDDSEKKEGSGLTNPFYWICAAAIALVWKWDEIVGYF